MADIEEKAQSDLRRMILNGTLPQGERISEVSAAEMLGVSRTPVKIALARLEMNGLLEKRPGRGYVVREVKLEDVENLLKVRGALEGLAVAHLATNGLDAETRSHLHASLAISASVVGLTLTSQEVTRYREANTLFHTTIMENCGNEFVQLAFERIRHFPMAALGQLNFDLDQPERETIRVQLGHAQHVIILDAIESGDATRAEAVMREHAHATLNYARLFSSDHAGYLATGADAPHKNAPHKNGRLQ